MNISFHICNRIFTELLKVLFCTRYLQVADVMNFKMSPKKLCSVEIF